MKNQLLVFILIIGGNFFAQNIVKEDSIKKQINPLKFEKPISNNLEITGWIQTQYQWAQSLGAQGFDGGDFSKNSNNRFMIRRGRVKFSYNYQLFNSVLQLNATEYGVNLVEIYGKITDPWTQSFSFQSGVMSRPFGFEIQQSSSDRETPERSRFTQTLLPNDRDIGAMIAFQPKKNSKLHGLKINAGLFNGTGISVPGTSSFGVGFTDFDVYKDIIARAFYTKSFKNDKYSFGIGTSYYNGGYVLQNHRVFNSMAVVNSMQAWIMEDTLNKTFSRVKAPRIYYDLEAQFSVKSPLGTTTLRGEYITGTQSGMIDDTKSPSTLPSQKDTYIRKFYGGYVYFIQRIAKSKHELVFKYELYDPNTQASALIGINPGSTLTKAELKYIMLGFGYNCYINSHVKMMLYYNNVKNEITNKFADYMDDVFTIRLQYRF